MCQVCHAGAIAVSARHRDHTLRGRRISVNASNAEATIRNRLTAFSTGEAPSRIRPYIITVSGGSEPTSINVVLKFSNDIRNEIAAAPINAGRRYGRVIVARTARRVAP